MTQRKYTEAQKKSAQKWDAANLDRISVALPKGSKDKIKAHADSTGESVNAFIGRAISAAIHSAPAQPAQPTPEGVPVYLPEDAYSAAQAAADAQGESIAEYTARAIHTQAERDTVLRRIRDSVTH